MNHKERIFKAARGETVDILPYAPRIDLWHLSNSMGDNLPERHKNRSHYDISRAEGWALHTATIDFTYQPLKDAMLHRAINAYALKEHVFQFVFSERIKIQISQEGDRTCVKYYTPKGMVQTTTVYNNEMKRGGVSIPWIQEHIIKEPKDYEIVACLFENMDLTPDDKVFLEWQREVGEDGLCAAYFTGAASPMHHIQKSFVNATNFFFHYNDFQKEMQFLSDSMAPIYNKALRIIADSPADAVSWGGNYHEMITYPPFFEKEFVPWIRKASEMMQERGKLVFSHCDGENQGLMNLIRDSGMHVAESICPYPMTKVRIEDYYKQWRDKLTIFGGIPSNLLLSETTSDEEFNSYIDNLFSGISPGDKFILGVADTTPRDADFNRLIRIGETVALRGRLPLEAGSARPLSNKFLQQAAVRVSSNPTCNTIFDSVQKDVLNGNEKAIGLHIQELIQVGMDSQRILNEGLIAAMEIIGPKFKAGELFIPEVLLASRAMNEGLKSLEPYFSKGQKRYNGIVLIGTVKGDLHDIGKNMVAMMLKGVGFQVIDMGINVPTEVVVEKVVEYKPHILALSALLTTTMPQMKNIIQALADANLRDKLKIMIGGAPVNQKFAREIEADGYGYDAGAAVDLAKDFMRSFDRLTNLRNN
jgi:corrinoid protein of di/trimethylamine methyltransferase